ncbi:MAG: bifunctional (p)ppGpp synthetase/guanosine-3',5'-bis(diphosphate) 3'-pyrophosphohydrolase [Ardenticatenales bacterium]|nr:bifunctional (p)ppGpp synthetase/guanosine-3',5'-bis(diphosphate) 3'-pyrophosphohydrolase [Ardenticatenales bacterium]
MIVEPAPAGLDELLTNLPISLSGEEKAAVQQAYEYACQAHGDTPYVTGESYLRHGLAVARIIGELGLDGYTIGAALVHDILQPHTNVSLPDVAKALHPNITRLVHALNEIIEYANRDIYRRHLDNDDEALLETIRRALLIIVRKDVNVILIRMADYVHDLRLAEKLSEQERMRLAYEAMNVYGPLANRLGVWQLKWELEDLAFRYLNPEDYRNIARKLSERRTERDKRVARAQRQLAEALAEFGIKAHVSGRSKHIYSIYRKMQRKRLGFEDIHDKYAIRVVIESGLLGQEANNLSKSERRQREIAAKSLCYQALGVVHELWTHIPQEFDDYIANPKANGYQSLHTAVNDKTGQTLEVQIRTDVMHQSAERGVAAHWSYKEGGYRPSSQVNKYIQNLRQLLNVDGDTMELVDGELLQTELLAERIYVFTPRGDMFDLPAGSTPIDFAYAIHTKVGHRCRGAKVNGHMVSLDYKLESGDRVEILTAKAGKEKPSRDWMNHNLGYTGNPRTRSKIRAWFRKQEKEKNIELGREMVERELKRLGLGDTFTVEDIAGALDYSKPDEFLASIGFGDIQSTQISGAIAKLRLRLRPDDELLDLFQAPKTMPSKGLTVRGVSGLQTRLAGCCTPIPPEPIIGYITRNQGVTIHSKDCKTMLAIEERERLIEVEWGVEESTHPVPIVIEAFRRPDLPENITKVLRGRNINVSKTKTTISNNILKVMLIVHVPDVEQLKWVLSKIGEIPNVLDVRRQKWSD